jgi:hypothetical protein
MLRGLFLIGCAQVFTVVASAQVQRIWLTHRSPDPNSIVVNWETAQPGNSIVRYGPTPELGQSRTVDGNATLHHVEIPLAHGVSRWYYRVQTGEDRSAVASFKGHPAEELRVAVIANLQGKPDLAAVVTDDVHILMTAGDNIPNLWRDGGGTQAYSRLIDAYPDLFRTTIFMPVLGNHDKEIRPRGDAPPQEPVYDVNATAFRAFFELPDEEWKWHFDVPAFDVRFIALDLNHISDMGTTWQACHPFAAGSEQFEWYDRLSRRTDRRFVVTLYNERNSNIRAKEGRRWHEMFRRGTVCITGFGYFAERAVFEGHPYFNTSVSGKGDRYPDPKSVFLASQDNYVLLTFQRQSNELVIDLKGLDGSVLDRTRYRESSPHTEP